MSSVDNYTLTKNGKFRIKENRLATMFKRKKRYNLLTIIHSLKTESSLDDEFIVNGGITVCSATNGKVGIN